MISFFKNRFFNKALSSHQNLRFTPKNTEFNKGAKVGIISSVEYQDEVDQFINYLIHKEVGVSVLYFDDTKEEKPNTYNKENISWCGVPTGEKITAFLSKEYDRFYFIDTGMNDHQEYLYRLSKACFTIGPCLTSNSFPFDLSINIEDMSISKLLKEMRHGIEKLSH